MALLIAGVIRTFIIELKIPLIYEAKSTSWRFLFVSKWIIYSDILPFYLAPIKISYLKIS